MKLKLFSLVVSIISLTNLGLFNIKPVVAAPEFKIYCGQNNQGIPTTFAKTLDRDIAIITWNKWLGDYSDKDRCKIVSANFQKANENDTIKFMHNGWWQGQRVICTAKKSQGKCETVLMTLRPKDDSTKILNDLRNLLRFARQVGPISHSGGEPHIYYQIDWEAFLENARLNGT